MTDGPEWPSAARRVVSTADPPRPPRSRRPVQDGAFAGTRNYYNEYHHSQYPTPSQYSPSPYHPQDHTPIAGPPPPSLPPIRHEPADTRRSLSYHSQPSDALDSHHSSPPGAAAEVVAPPAPSHHHHPNHDPPLPSTSGSSPPSDAPTRGKPAVSRKQQPARPAPAARSTIAAAANEARQLRRRIQNRAACQRLRERRLDELTRLRADVAELTAENIVLREKVALYEREIQEWKRKDLALENRFAPRLQFAQPTLKAYIK
ncbi:hypothetical protein DFJ73DRAFT_776247 [Zopfochytrium polystomum]|nr:hypothetical protein DFJ73DRAFT_776247 [Zopfochytrium polystomum]